MGGGPASLYFSLLAKKTNRDWDVTVYEQNPDNVTWGFGVVFSDETMENFKDADFETYKAITDSFVHWDEIDIFHKGHKIASRGHGFAGMQRLKLLQILEARAKELGVTMVHDVIVDNLDDHQDADLIVAGDGIASFIRDQHVDEFAADVVMRPNKFTWLGSTKAFDTFTFYFNQNEHGLWRAHCYQYMPGQSTFIIETTEDTWRRAGLENVTEAETVAYCSKVFEKELGDDTLITNNSVWRTFPRVRNGKYYHDNIVLLGDALHTAHFSIGSGTKLAMEDAVDLYESLNEHPGDLSKALPAFQQKREPDVDSLQRAAQVSMEWFENVERYHDVMEPLQFSYSLLTRSLRINHENLALRDQELVDEIDSWVADKAAEQTGVAREKTAPPPIFTPYKIRDMVLQNRVAVSPMCMYSAEDGLIGDFHLVHLGSRAMGGAGLIMSESTAISAAGRISLGCAGIYKDEHVTAWKRVVDYVHQNSYTKIGMQISHAGRKASTKLQWEGGDKVPLTEGAWPIMAASPIAYSADNPTPKEMTREDMDQVRDDFVSAAGRAQEAGFDMLELHCAHGYLLNTFISPKTNTREDEYGGSMENRLRYPLEVFAAIRAAWPAEKPISVRISANDWIENGITPEDAVEIAKAFKLAGCDILDVSSGQVVSEEEPEYGRLFQLPFSDRIRLEADMPTMTVGNIQSYADANSIIASGRGDICVIARMHLFDPYWTRHAAKELGYDLAMPVQYKAVEDYTPRWV
ncbi:MAG: bifunctional salicylyl-CoA 5-hydroxylase/oxidoreductase [Rhodospirillaceae bacterium]|nr:bifunctional salicylyl-CoA 5-hydroxylase/oxidoreductase [Rhodospirillaceae bacterium]